MLLLFSITTNAYALPDCPWKTSKLWDKCFGTYTYASGNQYVGEWKDNKQHGQGTLTYADGSKYVGEWKDGKMDSQVALISADESNYVGELKDDMKNGQGTYTYTNGDIYVGEWKDDIKNGQGTLTYANGETLTGEFRGNYIKRRTLSESDEADCYEERFREVTQLSTIYKSIKRQYRGLPSSYSYLSQNLTDEYYKDVDNADEDYELCKGYTRY